MTDSVSSILENPTYGPAPESDERAMDWLKGGGRSFGLYIDGLWVEAEGQFETRSPADGRLLATVGLAGKDDVARAVRSAAKAKEGWGRAQGSARARILYGIARALQRHARLFSVLESLDNGKSIRESRDLDIPLACRHFYHHAGWAQLSEHVFRDARPVGVVGQIIPWNFPLLMLAWKVAPALAAGNTVVLKPAEYTPLTALLFAELCDRAGLPPGVLNVLTGDGAAGAALVRHPGVDKIAFTGSTEVGREIRVATAGSGKLLSLELGGKSPFLVFEDADMDGAVEGVVDGVWLNQGEVCCAGSRLLVHESVEEDFIGRLKRRMENIRLGNPLDKSIDMGSLADASQLRRVSEYLRIAQADGAEVWQPERPIPENGSFVPPTLCLGAPLTSRVATEEVFGPVLVSHTFRTPDEAVQLANHTRYGLAASVWTENVNVALDIAPRLKAGTVWVNCTNRFDAGSGFGGYRESGFGREGGLEGMWEYLKPIPAPATGPEDVAGEDKGADISSAPPAFLDRTRKLLIGGVQARPDGGASLLISTAPGSAPEEVPRANRKDARNAVEAARKARGPWGRTSGHLRAQILYYLGENIRARFADFEDAIRVASTCSKAQAGREVEAAINLAFAFAAWADKNAGVVHDTPERNVVLAMNEPIGTIAARAPSRPHLAGAVGPIAAALSMGNAVVVVLSEENPIPGLDLVHTLLSSDVPAGVVNVLSGVHAEVVPTLAAHDDVDQLWDFVGDELSGDSERLSAGNLKRVWTDRDRLIDFLDLSGPQMDAMLRAAVQVKNIWVPYGA